MKFLMVCVGCVCLSFWVLSNEKAKPPKPPVVVEMCSPLLKTIPFQIKLPALLSPKTHANIRARTDGRVKSILFKEGRAVKAGDVLIELDDEQLQIQLRQARATFDKDQALLLSAQHEYERHLKLIKENVISKATFEDVKATAENLRATVAYDQATIDALQLQIAYSKIKSPIDGYVGLRQIEEGTFVRMMENAPLTTVKDIKTLLASFYIPERFVSDVLQNFEQIEIDIRSVDNPEKSFKAKLIALDNALEGGQGTLAVKAEIDNSSFSLRPGMSVMGHLTLKTLNGVLTIPEAAMRMGAKGPYVFVHDQKAQSVKMLHLSIDHIVDGLVVLPKDTPLKETDEIVLKGQMKLRDGSLVIVSPQDNEKHSDTGGKKS